MKITSTRADGRTKFQHAVGFYPNQNVLIAQAVPILQAALERGEPVAVALRPATERALVDAVGRPAGLIGFADSYSIHESSAQTTATHRARELRALAADFGTATVLTEHSTRLDGLDGSFWTELDAALNVACADLPVSMTCFYPEMALHRQIIVGARLNHPLVLVNGELRYNPEHRPPREVLAEYPPSHPPVLGAPNLRFTFRAWQLHELRTFLAHTLHKAGYDLDRAQDVVLAVNEVATNAVEHGTLEAELLVWLDDDGLLCEVHDGGVLTDLLPGMHAPRPAEERGRGIWVARQLCDVLQVWRDPGGTRVRIRASP